MLIINYIKRNNMSLNIQMTHNMVKNKYSWNHGMNYGCFDQEMEKTKNFKSADKVHYFSFLSFGLFHGIEFEDRICLSHAYKIFQVYFAKIWLVQVCSC